MFAFAPIPFTDRGAGAIHLAPLLLLWSSLGESLQVLADEAHLRFDGVPAGDDMELAGIPFKAPERAELEALHTHLIPPAIGARLERQCNDPLTLFHFLLTQVDEELSNWYASTLGELATRGLRAVVAWSNMPSLEGAARLHDLPVIHLELGPLRAPVFCPSMYVDFKGVNGDSEAPAVVGEYLRQPSDIDFDSARWAWTRAADRVRALSQQAPKYSHGVALQVEDDSNTVAFGQGVTGIDVVYRAWQATERSGRVLVRDHPSAHFHVRHFPFVDVDQSEDSIEFVSRCATVHTINSSVAFEAVFLGRQANVYGDSPLLALPQDEPVRTQALAGLFFAYLVPAALALSPEYLNWRLERPHAAEIARAHLDFLLAARGEVTRPTVDGAKSDSIPPAFDSCAVGIGWLRSLSFVQQRAALNEQIAWLVDQRNRWKQRAEELEVYLKTLQEANAWLDQQRLDWARNASEQADAARKALEANSLLQAEVQQLSSALKDAQFMREASRLRAGLSKWTGRWFKRDDRG
ncbi:MAG: hypothetical protein U1E71_07155 [Ramlibacter sp.]